MNIDEKLEELQGLTSKYIKSIAMDLVVVLVAIAYIFYQMVTLEPTKLNPLVLIAQAIMGIICGVVIKQALGENGFSRGYNSKIWVDEEEKYNAACNTANPYMERVDNFYQYEEIEKKRNYRRAKLQGARLKYDEWFDKDGNYIGTIEMYEKLDKKQKRVLNKSIKVKIYPLNLFSQYSISSDQATKPEITDRKQRERNVAKNTISATLIAIIGVYFVPLLNSWSWASFISATMQVTLWVLFGIIQLYTNYNFIVQDKVALLRTKKECIRRFTTGCEKGLYVKSPYDEQVEEQYKLELAKQQ
ncbi:hypothetical protein IKJ53_06390 [bacterium]|nr:hypothetical protein [bacterium]